MVNAFFFVCNKYKSVYVILEIIIRKKFYRIASRNHKKYRFSSGCVGDKDRLSITKLSDFVGIRYVIYSIL